jgi:hypothetical protein
MAFFYSTRVTKPANKELDKKAKQKKWLKRIGVAGFLFFLIKGLIWIAVFLFAWKGCK